MCVLDVWMGELLWNGGEWMDCRDVVGRACVVGGGEGGMVGGGGESEE
jgi:hypothetical protein